MMRGAVVFLVFLSQALADELLLVQALWRHGDRVPQETFKDDPYQESFWGRQWGELTNIGMAQSYQQGLRLKERYIDELKFLNATYRSEDIYVRSSDFPRALQSAYSNLAAFYSGSSGTHPMGNLWPSTWTPVPVHTIEKERDQLLVWSSDCPRREQLIDEQKRFKGFLDYLDKHKALLNEVTAKTGFNATDCIRLEVLYDTLWIEKLYNLTLPAWLTPEKLETLKEITDLSNDYLYGYAEFGNQENIELARLVGGVLLSEILGNIHKAIEGTTTVKYFAYSAHDNAITSLLQTFGAKKEVIPERVPDYASVVVLELWKTSEGGHQVRLLFSANAESPFKTVTRAINGCPPKEHCPLEVIEKRSEKYVSRNIQEECKERTEKEGKEVDEDFKAKRTV